ncbi:MAG: hypothetical protein Q9162_003754 [Coniocarpon cinnabarinum]
MNHIIDYLAPAPASPFFAASALHNFLSQPTSFLARLLYALLSSLRPTPRPSFPPVRIVCISDTHTLTKSIPDGDLLIHAGDLCNVGNPAELNAQIAWLDSLPHRHKVVIAGNHDAFLDARSRRTLSKPDQGGGIDWRGVHYLQHSATTLVFPGRTLKIYGAPQVPALGGSEHAFQYARGQDAWTETVPSDADIVVTHTPPKFHRDLQVGHGCEWLLKEIERVRPKLHVCAHIHDDRGVDVLWWNGTQRAYERIRERGTWQDTYCLIDPRNWLDMTLMVISTLKAVIWRAVWGGKEMSRATVCVNAALMENSTGKLSHEPIIVYL